MLYIKPRLTFFYDPAQKEWDSVQVPNPAGFTTDYHLLVAEETSHGPIAWVRRNGSSTIFDLYLFDVENMVWRQLVTTGDALPNNYTDPNGVVYDSKRDRLLFFSENSGKEYVWEYSFETGRVTRSTPSGTPFSGYRRECVYMPNLDIVVIQGNRGYNCATNEWIYLAIANGAGVGSTNTVSSGYMYDKKRDIVWDSETRCDNLYALRLTSLALTSAENPNGSNKVNNKLEIKALPNPFNPVVSITTGLDGQTARIISIYDLSGRLVMESKADFVWDATLNPAGTYIVKVRSAGSETMKKITLLK
jgi:hypothetical protein